MRRWPSIILLVAALMLLLGAGAQHSSLIRMRAEHHLDAAAPLENAPPLMVFSTVVLAGFRGLLADVLWLRISYLQDEGRFFELVQLSDWIAKLEPRCAEIWTFHAWNMAYNVSAMMPEEEDRWRWVRHGIHLLRDEGIVYNPADPDVFWELGWLFQHKIGGKTDKANVYYKRRWAEQMTDLFHGSGPDYTTLAADTGTVTRLVDDYKLVPEYMEAVDAEFGPLDWRLPASHAIYWAWRGRRAAGDEGSLRCDRMIFQNMAATFLQGQLVSVPEKDLFMTAPRIELLPKARQAYEQALTRHGGHPSVLSAYAYFIKDAILTLSAFNQKDDAEALYDVLRERMPTPEWEPPFETFVAKAMTDSIGRLTTAKALSLVQGLLFQSLVRQAAGETERAAQTEALALRHWNACLNRLSADAHERLDLPTLEDLRWLAFEHAVRELPEESHANLPINPEWP